MPPLSMSLVRFTIFRIFYFLIVVRAAIRKKYGSVPDYSQKSNILKIGKMIRNAPLSMSLVRFTIFRIFYFKLLSGLLSEKIWFCPRFFPKSNILKIGKMIHNAPLSMSLVRFTIFSIFYFWIVVGAAIRKNMVLSQIIPRSQTP